MDKFELARRKYKPGTIEYLLIAEAPPKTDSNRFFYFENVMEQDSLFIETIKVLYPKETSGVDIRQLRMNKRSFLMMFQNDGFYLIDSLKNPFEEKYSPRQRMNLIKCGQENLMKRMKLIINDKTQVILISATVYKANFSFLLQQGINVINKELIDFPGSGGQAKFREKLKRLLS
jgi:hypothetical protein